MSVSAVPLVLKEGDKEKLEAVLRASTAPVALVMRTWIVLLAAEGLANAEICRRVGVSGPTVLTWRSRYAAMVGAGSDHPANERLRDTW